MPAADGLEPEAHLGANGESGGSAGERSEHAIADALELDAAILRNVT